MLYPRTFCRYAVLLLAGLVLAVGKPAAAEEASAKQPTNAVGFAVVELFTSQGCSSCPPADQLLGEIDDLADKNRMPVYALSMHIDYWNKYGWADPHSSERFSRRQRRYADAVGLERMYTPQMIVNGGEGFSGSDAKTAKQRIDDALKRPAAAKLELKSTTLPKGKVRVGYRVDGVSEAAEVVLCLVADASPNDVHAGENKGRRLAHRCVVREMHVVKLAGAGSGEVTLGSAPRAVGEHIIGFVQHPKTRRIVGAARAEVGKPSPDPSRPAATTIKAS